ncbi:MAG: pilus assembly protein, partial [Oricola sp.]|nr:pilus assembly protein [Oricola sp.]
MRNGLLSALRRGVKRWLSNDSGVAAAEAALIAPIFVLSALAVFDLGLAGAKRLDVDQALRAGAQASMMNITNESDILAATLAALGENAQGEVQDDGICAPNSSCVDVDYACKC